ncbi:WD repeat-containing protein [Planoprotostelium fungivorum]|uniref:WD repeat-containing protein n=1 Tax=Planoprotostelium fungivorum TaxID=1890364 RepID=A0A2P6MV00_9EUKA|nr:WD repeat-containing protein [Planoprotostelium fungivorum]
MSHFRRRFVTLLMYVTHNRVATAVCARNEALTIPEEADEVIAYILKHDVYRWLTDKVWDEAEAERQMQEKDKRITLVDEQLKSGEQIYGQFSFGDEEILKRKGVEKHHRRHHNPLGGLKRSFPWWLFTAGALSSAGDVNAIFNKRRDKTPEGNERDAAAIVDGSIEVATDRAITLKEKITSQRSQGDGFLWNKANMEQSFKQFQDLMGQFLNLLEETKNHMFSAVPLHKKTAASVRIRSVSAIEDPPNSTRQSYDVTTSPRWSSQIYKHETPKLSLSDRTNSKGSLLQRLDSFRGQKLKPSGSISNSDSDDVVSTTSDDEDGPFLLVKKCRPLHSSSVLCMALVEDYLWVGCENGLLRLWSKSTCQSQGDFKAHEEGVTCIIGVDGKVWTGCRDGTVQVWSFNGERVMSLKRISASSSKSPCVFLLHNEKRVLCGRGDGQIALYSAKSGKHKGKVFTGKRYLTTSHRHGKMLLLAAEGEMIILDLTTLRITMTVPTPDQLISTFASNGAFEVWSSGRDEDREKDIIRCWDIQTGRCLRAITSEGRVSAMKEVRQNNVNSVWVCLEGGHISVHGSNNYEIMQEFEHHTDSVHCITIDDRSQIWTGSSDTSTCIWRRTPDKRAKSPAVSRHPPSSLSKDSVIFVKGLSRQASIDNCSILDLQNTL